MKYELLIPADHPPFKGAAHFSQHIIVIMLFPDPLLASILIKSGALQLAAAFIWGPILPSTPYPRIGLSTHLNMIQEGLLAIAAGLVTRDPDLVKLSDWQLNLIVWAHVGLWGMDIISVFNSFWGTNRTLKMVRRFCVLRSVLI